MKVKVEWKGLLHRVTVMEGRIGKEDKEESVKRERMSE